MIPAARDSTTSRRCSSLEVTPLMRRNASSVRRATTAWACSENTRKAPVKSATSASTLRLTRYARETLETRCADSSGVVSVTPGGSSAAIFWRASRARARGELDVDSMQAPDLTESLLRGTDVERGHFLAGARARQHARNAEGLEARPDLKREVVAGPQPEAIECSLRKVQAVSEQPVLPLRRCGLADQRR